MKPLLPAIILFTSSLASAIPQDTPAILTGWLPVTDAERKLSAPTVEKGAGAEALFWRVHVLDSFRGSDPERALYHYVRLKIFDEKGKEKAATIDIPFGNDTYILSLSGRTIKPDGTILELKKDAVYERDLVRAGGTRRKVKSFAMPGVEPGAIVEYRWKELRLHPRMLYLRLQFQREFPVQRVTYFLKPIPQEYTTYSMSVLPFNCKPSPLKLENDGFNSTTLENVPAFKEEPMMPGEPNVRPWVLVFYREDEGNRDQEKYWNKVGKNSWTELKSALRVNDEIKAAAAKAVEGAKDDSAKVTALIRYLRQNVRNLYDSRRVTEAERSDLIKHLPKTRLRTAAEVMQSGIAAPDEFNLVFAAMATQVGLDARPALVADRTDIVFHPALTERYFLPNIDMAVKIGEDWKLYDVSARHLAPGMVSWREEGAPALVSDPKKPVFIQSRLSPAAASIQERKARATLSAEGDLEADVDETYTGHSAAERRTGLDLESDARRQELLKEAITRIFPNAEVTAIRLESADSAEQPLRLHYHLKVPGYAQRTGKRLFFKPLFVEAGSSPRFQSTERHYDIEFQYGWTETDAINIKLPAGFQLDNAETPGGMKFGKPGHYDYKLAVNSNGELVCQRELVFADSGMVQIPRNVYPKLKEIFDEVHRRDGHTISLKQAAAPAPAGGK